MLRPKRTRWRQPAARSAMLVGGVWLLCTLLLLFAGNARLLHYRTLQSVPRTPATQPFGENIVGSVGLSLAMLLLLWSVVAAAAQGATDVRVALAARPRWDGFCAGQYNPELHLRAPPRH